jgi:hypothetical protein
MSTDQSDWGKLLGEPPDPPPLPEEPTGADLVAKAEAHIRQIRFWINLWEKYPPDWSPSHKEKKQ